MSARHAPRFTVVVVLPTPPFWLATAMIRGRSRAKLLGGGAGAGSASVGTVGALIGGAVASGSEEEAISSSIWAMDASVAAVEGSSDVSEASAARVGST